jgi:putative DNA primase/helicase
MSTTTKIKTKTATHTEMARMYIGRHWQDTIFTRSQWYHYENGVWNPKHDLAIEHEMWQLLEEYETKNQCRPTKTILSSVSSRIMARFFVLEDQVDAHPHLVNLTNGVYSMEDGNLYPHKQDYYLTTQLPFDHDKTANAPTFQLFLMSTFVKPRSTEPDLELIEFLQEAIGYSLTTANDFHVTFWCYGEGANGKGVLFHILNELGGTSVVPLNVGRLKYEQYQLADLAGKRIALCSEASATKNLVEDALIKSLISGDTMNVRQIRGKPFALKPCCKLWWAMNKLPAVADTSHGFWRRMRVIPFNRQFSEDERIRDLKERLSRELPGIFNWAMAGLKRLRKMGHFTEPKQVLETTGRYKKESNPVELFIEDYCEVKSSERIQSSIIYASYKDWCDKNTFRALSSKNFKDEMHRLGYFSLKSGGLVWYEGLNLNKQQKISQSMP